MFPSLLPHTTRSTLKTAPKLLDFCVCKSYFKNVVNSGATSLCGHQLNYKNSLTGTARYLPSTENSRSTYVSFENGRNHQDYENNSTKRKELQRGVVSSKTGES